MRERFESFGLDVQFNPVIDTLIDEVSADMLSRMGRNIEEADYTEYHSGDGGRRIHLRQGPLVSITSVETIAYSNVGDARFETETEVDPSYYVECGIQSEGHQMLGSLYRITGCWPVGARNIKVVYRAGFATVPEDIASAATNRVIELFNTRGSVGLESTLEGDSGSIEINPVAVSIRQYMNAISAYKVPAVA